MGAAEVVKQQSLNVRTFRPARPRTSEAKHQAKHPARAPSQRWRLVTGLHSRTTTPARASSTAGQAHLHMLHLTSAASSHTSLLPRVKEAL
jgi:hypothetical protein